MTERNTEIRVQCIECGETHPEEQEPDYQLSIGDYAEFVCPVCGEETEHRVEWVEEEHDAGT